MPVVFLVEVHAPFDELPDLGGRAFHNLLDGGAVAEEVAGDHGVFYVLFEIVDAEVGDGSHATLRVVGVCFFYAGFANECNPACFRHFQRETHAGDAGAYHEVIVFVDHGR